MHGRFHCLLPFRELFRRAFLRFLSLHYLRALSLCARYLSREIYALLYRELKSADEMIRVKSTHERLFRLPRGFLSVLIREEFLMSLFLIMGFCIRSHRVRNYIHD